MPRHGMGQPLVKVCSTLEQALLWCASSDGVHSWSCPSLFTGAGRVCEPEYRLFDKRLTAYSSILGAVGSQAGPPGLPP